jgi:lipid-binding SYLF domain-containing protein
MAQAYIYFRRTKMNKTLFAVSTAIALALLPLASPAQDAGKVKKAAEARQKLHVDTQGAIARMKKTDPGTEAYFKQAAGYAVFPSVGKVGFVLGGGHGDGEVYQAGKPIGVASVTLGSLGLQAGAQKYSEIVFFQDADALDRFKQSKFEFSGSASAVIGKAGAAKEAVYRDGYVVFVQAIGGAMAEASLGSQKYKFKAE